MTETFTTTIPVRYRDLDMLGHVNNAVYSTYLETARIEYLSTLFENRTLWKHIVVVSQSIDFHRSITDIDEIAVSVETTDIGNTSWVMRYVVIDDGETVARGESTIVVLDSDTGTPIPVSAEIRERVMEFDDVDASTVGISE